MEKKTTQEKFDALVAEDGAEAVKEAYKNHSVEPLSGQTCDTGYVWDSVLKKCVFNG